MARAKTVSAEKQQIEADNEAVVYIGLNNLRKGLKTYTVYKAKPEALIDSLKAEIPFIGRLFVPVAQLNQAMESVKKKGTPLNLAYREMGGVE